MPAVWASVSVVSLVSGNLELMDKEYKRQQREPLLPAIPSALGQVRLARIRAPGRAFVLRHHGRDTGGTTETLASARASRTKMLGHTTKPCTCTAAAPQRRLQQEHGSIEQSAHRVPPPAPLRGALVCRPPWPGPPTSCLVGHSPSTETRRPPPFKP